MNWIDLALIALVGVSVGSGVRQGFSRSGFGFLAVVLAFLSAAWLYPADSRGFLAGFIMLLCLGSIGAFLLGRWVKSAEPKWLDSALGGVFGLTNALLFFVFAALVLMAFAPKFPRECVARSAVAPYAFETACKVAKAVPDEMKFQVERSYEELENVMPARFRKAVPPLPRTEI